MSDASTNSESIPDETNANQPMTVADHTGQELVSTQTVTHSYITQNGKVVREIIDDGGTYDKILDFIYDNQGRPLALNYSTNGGNSFTTYYYVSNLQGDVIKLVRIIPDFEFETAAEYTYDAWGNVISATGSMANINPLRYRGYYYDSETGFYYLQSRYYDPANHRFINADSYASTDATDAIACNMFAYCGNNPVLREDQNGEGWLSAIVGAAVGAVVGAVSAAITGGDLEDVIIGAVSGLAAGAVIGATGNIEAGEKVGKVVGSACNAVGTYISVKRHGGTTGEALLCAGASFGATYLSASLPTDGDVLAEGLVAATFGFGANLVVNSVASATTKDSNTQKTNKTQNYPTKPRRSYSMVVNERV